MRARTALAAVITTLAAAAPASAAGSGLVIGQAYGGGGNADAPFTHDFVEVFNRGTAAASVDGWSIQYASATGTGTFAANAVTALGGTIPPGGRLLVRLAGGPTGAPLPTPDAIGTVNMSATGGKVALVRSAAGLACNGGTTPCSAEQRARIADLLGFGAATFREGAAAPAGSNTRALLRRAGGCADTDDNAADFTTAPPEPRNAAAEPTPCGGGPGGTGSAAPAAVLPGEETTLAVTTAATSVTADLTPIGGAAQQPLLDPDGDGTFTHSAIVDPATAPGAKALTATLTDDRGLTGTATIDLTVTEPCDLPVTPVSALQGTGRLSPHAGETASVEGVVVATFQQPGGFGGFFLQDPRPDDDPATSEGIFVQSGLGAVRAGDAVRVRGRVAELATGASRLTALTGVSQVTPCGAAAPLAATDVALPADLERFEGMRVRLPQPLTISDTFTLARFGELRVAAGGRLFTPTNLVAPGPAAQALAAENARRSLVLDDGSNRQNPDPAPYGLSAERTVRSGDVVPGVEGVLDDRFGFHRVQPTSPVTIEPRNPRPAAPAPVGGTLQVAAFNVLNFFNGPGFPTPRGASSRDELARQTAKEVSALAGLDADVVGLMELENDGGEDQAVEELVAAINERVGAGTYAHVDTGVVGGDAIRVGLLYKPAVVRPVGRPAVLDSSVDPRFADGLNRPTIAQAFELRENLERVVVAVNHLKSKGSDCDDVGDPDTGDGQGNCHGTRTRAAAALADWLATDPTGSGTTDSLIVGDLNSYAEEDPIRVLREAGYVDQIRRFGGPGAYSYVFDGQAGYLDHGLASRSLSPKVSGATDWHINADEPVALDYNVEFKSPAQLTSLYAPGPYRSSDHDPLLVGLDLRPSFADAIALTQRFVDGGPARGLVAKLEAARAARARDDAEAEAGALRAYRRQLDAQAGKAVTEERAALLQHISTQLTEDR